MTHRLLAVIVVACLLGACSCGDGAADGSPPEQSQATELGESPVPEDGGVPESSTDSADSLSAADELAGGSAAVDEPQQDPADSKTRPNDESASEIESPPPVSAASSSGLRVLRAYVCKGIEQGEPTEAGKSFVPQDGVLRLCCFSEIAGAAGPDSVFHIWRWGDREMARVPLEVKSSRWRTWSTKRILDEWRGEWHVDVTDREGGVLTSLEFSVE
ncbi:MAG: DUF2914 domain-containing protein [Candidatus Eisenbacteria bacterium]